LKNLAGVLALAVVVLCSHAALCDPGPQRDLKTTFDQACDLYEGGDFDGALADFEAISASGIRNSTVYFNLGNCYYKHGSLGRAIASYRRSLMLAPRDTDARINLGLVRSSVGGGDTTATYGRGLGGFPLQVISPRHIQVLFYLAYYLAAALFLCVLFLRGRLRRMAAYALVAAVVVSAAAFGLSRYSLSRFNSVLEAVVIADRTELKSGPGNAFEELASLPDGSEVTLRARSGMWIEVKLPTGEVGWVREKDIETI
jgi:tetratricopeptide (TPR) repeat protein